MKKTRTPVSLLLCTLLAMLMLLMLLPLGTVSFAAGETPGDTVVTVVETGDCGAEGSDVQYTLYSDGTLIIEGTGAVKQNAFYRNEAIKSLIMQEGITSIALSAFSECLKLETVVLPDSLTRIGDWAFYCCRTLQSLEGGNHMKSLGRGALAATGLKRYKIPDSVETIDECLYLFDDSTAIEEVIFGRGIRELSDSGIQDYRHGTLTKVVFLNKDTVIPNGPFNRIFSTGAVPTIYGFAGGAVEAYANQYDHPFVDLATYHEYDDGVITTEPTYTEDGVKTFTCTLCGDSYTEPVPAIAAVKTGQIGPDVYYTIYENGHADIYGTGDTYAGFYANHTTFFGFSLPVEITSLEVQPGVTGLLSEFGFSHLLKLQSVKLPASLTSINYAMFHFCLSLESIDVDPENPVYTTVDGVLYNKSVTELVHYPLGKKDKTYTVPAGVKRIEQRAFEAVRNLEEIILPDTLETIGFGAFMGAPDLNTVHLGNGVVTIDDYAFYRVDHVPTITIPGTVKYIGEWAFGYRPYFTDVYYPCPKEAWDKIEFGSENEPLLDATLHFGEHAYDGGEITTPATCGEDGIKTFTCQNCGDTYTETIPATGAHSYNGGTVTTRPTCTEDGVKTFTCAVCGSSYTEPVAATGHNWSEWIVTRNPSETREGEAYRYCKNDPSHIEHKTIDKLPETNEEGGNIFQQILDWVKSFFDSIGDLFRNLFRF